MKTSTFPGGRSSQACIAVRYWPVPVPRLGQQGTWCVWCQKPFTALVAAIAAGAGLYCSLACHDASHQHAR